jgi:uncharacterized small protein (DUF1192 family)
MVDGGWTSIMPAHLLRTALPMMLAGMLGAPLACADVYTWTDASGRVNVSNIAPPAGVHVSHVVHEDPAKKGPKAAAAHDAAREADVQALTERVAELQDEVERARRQVPAPATYRAVPPPPIQIAVNVIPPAPPVDYAPPAAPYAANCDPTVFGCPVFGYPANVIVLRTPRFHRFHRFDQPRAGHRFPAARPVQPGREFRRR